MRNPSEEEVVPGRKWQGSDPEMSEEEVRAERTFSLRKISLDSLQIIARDAEMVKALQQYKRSVT